MEIQKCKTLEKLEKKNNERDFRNLHTGIDKVRSEETLREEKERQRKKILNIQYEKSNKRYSKI